jgi:hypothetical protein
LLRNSEEVACPATNSKLWFNSRADQRRARASTHRRHLFTALYLQQQQEDTMKVDVNALRYLTKDDFRVLTAVEICQLCFLWCSDYYFEM